MKLVTVRLESNLKRILNELAEIRNLKISDIARELIELGTRAQALQEIKLIGSMKVEVPFEDISLGGEQERLNLYVDERQLNLAKKVFRDDGQSVLRKALRTGVFYIMPPVNEQTNLPFSFSTRKRFEKLNQEQLELIDASFETIQIYQDELMKIHTVESYIITDRMENVLLNTFIPSLNIRNFGSRPILVSGAYGTGKTHLIKFVAALAENAELLNWVDRSDFKSLTDNFAGHYVPVFASNQGTLPLQEQVTNKIMTLFDDAKVRNNSQGEGVTANLNKLMDRFDESNPSKGLLLILDMDEINVEDLQFIRELIDVSSSRRLKLIVESGSNMTLEGLNDFLIESFTEIHLENRDIEGVFHLTQSAELKEKYLKRSARGVSLKNHA